jgi:hypothetical protein
LDEVLFDFVLSSESTPRGELRMIESKFPFRQFFDFRLGIDGSHFFNFPTLSKRCTTCAIRVSVAQLATPIERALFCRLSSQATLSNGLQVAFSELNAAARLDCSRICSAFSWT